MASGVAEQASRVEEILGLPGTFLIERGAAAASGSTLPTVDPGTGKTLTEVPLNGCADIAAAVVATRQALGTGNCTPPGQAAQAKFHIAPADQAGGRTQMTQEIR
jgi:hypothetical protein